MKAQNQRTTIGGSTRISSFLLRALIAAMSYSGTAFGDFRPLDMDALSSGTALETMSPTLFCSAMVWESCT